MLMGNSSGGGGGGRSSNSGRRRYCTSLDPITFLILRKKKLQNMKIWLWK
jgi:hypothetical protein